MFLAQICALVDQDIESARIQTVHGMQTSNARAASQPNTELSQAARDKIDLALGKAWARSTLEKYSGGLVAFHHFCDAEGIHSAQRLPANEFLLCAFAASRIGQVAGSTVRGTLAAVKAWHIINDADWRGGIRLRYVVKGVENAKPEGRDERPPVTEDMLNVLEAELNLNDPKDAAVFAAACCSFWGQLRLGEILPETQSKYPKDRIPLASDLKPPSSHAGSRVLRLPWTKTSGRKGENAMLCRQHGRSDPVNAVEKHLAINQVDAHLPLFSYRTNTGLICLSKKIFLKRCNEIWNHHGYPAYSGHCFRIGGTTHLLIAGVNPDVVQAMGRWRSEAFKVYWRRLDLLAPLHTEYLGT